MRDLSSGTSEDSRDSSIRKAKSSRPSKASHVDSGLSARSNRRSRCFIYSRLDHKVSRRQTHCLDQQQKTNCTHSCIAHPTHFRHLPRPLPLAKARARDPQGAAEARTSSRGTPEPPKLNQTCPQLIPRHAEGHPFPCGSKKERRLNRTGGVPHGGPSVRRGF